jgi:uncharacterized protein YeaO (DUF488 family)
MTLCIARVYDVGKKRKNEYRVLVDRIWPRGISKNALELDEWLKDIAPSNELRKWFGHDRNKWEQFKTRYLQELTVHKNELSRLADIAGQSDLVLLYSAKDIEHNQAIVIQEAVEAVP